MDVATLAAAAVAGMLPFLGHAVDSAAEKLGESTVEAGGKLLAWIRKRASGETATALAKLEAAPDDAATRQALEAALHRQLDASPASAAELQMLLLQTGHTITVDHRGSVNNSGTQVGVVTNSQNVSVHVSGVPGSK